MLLFTKTSGLTISLLNILIDLSKRVGSDEVWDKSEKALLSTIDNLGIPPTKLIRVKEHFMGQ